MKEPATQLLELARPDVPERTPEWTDVLATLGRESALAVLVLASVAVAMVLVLLLAFVAAPLAAFLVGWLIWRSGHASRRPIRRLRARWGREARILEGGDTVREASRSRSESTST
jgi:hypothetical protein